jgi:hypothetical protein
MMKKGGIVGTIVVIGLIAVWKLVLAPSGEKALIEATGKGWDDAKGEIKPMILEGLSEGLKDSDVGPMEKGVIADCVTDKVVEFLNGTDCSYLYVETVTSKEEHLKQQEECFVKVKLEEKEEAFMVECMKAKLPNDWKIARSSILKAYEEAMTDIADTSLRKKTAECITDKTIAILNGSDCKPINDKATTAEELVTPADGCMDKPGLADKLAQAGTECAPK